jgi:GNAT superfamily N-acetyltransferase
MRDSIMCDIDKPASDKPYVLRAAQSADEWAAYHAIRRDAIFALYFPGLTYDDAHPDEVRPGNHPHVLVHGEEIVGTVRVDLIDATRAGLRLIAVKPGLQRLGHGTALLAAAERFLQQRATREITINATNLSFPFYFRHGYRPGEWKDAGPVPDGLIRVGKRFSQGRG